MKIARSERPCRKDRLEEDGCFEAVDVSMYMQCETKELVTTFFGLN